MGAPLSPETLVYGLTSAGDPQVSPDGTAIIYTLSSTDRDTKKASSQVWRCAIDGGRATRLTWTGERNRGERRQLTTEPVDYYFPQWSPDGRWLSSQVPNRNEMCSQLGLTSVETGETRLIGPELGVVSVWGWSPTSDRILFAGDTEQTWQ